MFQTCKTFVYLQNTNKDIFEISKSFLTLHIDSNRITKVQAQKCSKYTVKIVHVTLVVQL